MIGKALVVAWSFTLINPSSLPQVVNVGPAVTQENYVPAAVVVKNSSCRQSFGFAAGPTYNRPTDIISTTLLQRINDMNGYQYGSVYVGAQIYHADSDLYVKYWGNGCPDKSSVDIDVLAYPTK
jgi:hypothetical protein